MAQRGDFIPPVSDYAHWNEDASRVWYEENKYDMEHWDEPVGDDLDDYVFFEDEDIDPIVCGSKFSHYENTSGHDYLFGPNADVIASGNEICDNCGIDLVSTWVPKGYKVTRDTMIAYREMFTKIGRKHLVPYEFTFPVYEKVQ